MDIRVKQQIASLMTVIDEIQIYFGHLCAYI